MEFYVKMISSNHLVLCLDRNSPFINTRVIWIEEILMHKFRNLELIKNIFKTINESGAKIETEDRLIGDYIDLTKMEAEDRDRLVDQLNGFLIMEALIR